MSSQKIKRNAKKFLNQQKQEKAVPYLGIINTILFGLFLSALLLTIWEIEIYQKTFIPVVIPLTIWILPGAILTPCLKKILDIYLETQLFFLQLVFNVVTFGGFIVFAFMWVNYNFCENEKIVTNEKIISTGHLAKGRGIRCSQPYIKINYKGQNKQLIYYCGTNVEDYKSVNLEIAKGLFGFEVIVQSNLKKD